MSEHRLCPNCSARCHKEETFCTACGEALPALKRLDPNHRALGRRLWQDLGLDWVATLLVAFGLLYLAQLALGGNLGGRLAPDPLREALAQMTPAQRGLLAVAPEACGLQLASLPTALEGLETSPASAAEAKPYCAEIKTLLAPYGATPNP